MKITDRTIVTCAERRFPHPEQDDCINPMPWFEEYSNSPRSIPMVRGKRAVLDEATVASIIIVMMLAGLSATIFLAVRGFLSLVKRR